MARADLSATDTVQILSGFGPLPQTLRPALQRVMDEPPVSILDDLPNEADHGGERHRRLFRRFPQRWPGTYLCRFMVS